MNVNQVICSVDKMAEKKANQMIIDLDGMKAIYMAI